MRKAEVVKDDLPVIYQNLRSRKLSFTTVSLGVCM